MSPRTDERTYRAGALTAVVRLWPEGRATMVLQGQADLDSAGALTEAIAGLLLTPCRRLEVDLAELDFLDSAGVRALLVGDHVLGSEVLVALLHPRPNVRRVLDVLELDQVFEIER